MTVAKKRGGGTSAKRSMTPVRMPLSLRAELERKLDGWQEWEGDDDRCILRNDLPYARVPANAAARLVADLSCVCRSPAVNRRLELLRSEIVALLRTTTLDDLDSVALLEWLVDKGKLEFVDDLHALSEPQRAELEANIEAAIKAAVDDDMSVPKFANRMVQTFQAWAKRRSIATTALEGMREDLEAGFGGIVWYRSHEAQQALAHELLDDVTRVLNIRWVASPKPPQPYSRSRAFAVGDRIVHPRFGEGDVVRRLDGKVEVRFADAKRTLAARN